MCRADRPAVDRERPAGTTQVRRRIRGGGRVEGGAVHAVRDHVERARVDAVGKKVRRLRIVDGHQPVGAGVEPHGEVDREPSQPPAIEAADLEADQGLDVA